MAKDRATLKADGIVTVADLVLLAQAMADVLAALTEDTAHNPKAIDWVVDGLRAGSATITAKGFAGTFLASHDIEHVVEQYDQLARNANKGRINQFPPSVQTAVRKLAGLVNGKITRISLNADDASPTWWGIDPSLGSEEGNQHADLKEGVDVNRYARSSIKGQVVTLDDKRGVYFTLREAYTGELVRCYPGKKIDRAKLSEYWAASAWIIAEGTFQRYAQTPTMHEITTVIEIEKAKPGSWRDAIGCAPRQNNREVSSAEAVRRIRDG